MKQANTTDFCIKNLSGNPTKVHVLISDSKVLIVTCQDQSFKEEYGKNVRNFLPSEILNYQFESQNKRTLFIKRIIRELKKILNDNNLKQ